MNVLEKYLKGNLVFIICYKKTDIIAFFPLIKKRGKYGFVYNSLPFFGSNGGIISNNILATNELVDFYNSYMLDQKSNICSSTIITSPYINTKINTKYDFIEERFSQMTELSLGYEKKFEKSALRNIRKAERNNISVCIDNSQFNFVYESYYLSMRKIAWKLKEKEFFKIIEEKLIPTFEYNIFIAKFNKEKVASLLLFYFNNTVEYFTPSTLPQYRKLQPMSLILKKAMNDSFKRGYKYWNWGGTWLSQDKVFRFKKKWGACSTKYYYYTSI